MLLFRIKLGGIASHRCADTEHIKCALRHSSAF